ncbi:hypothetical protein ElyMa_001335900 [Elysia marginata]|uniref:Uncharacterized protein n=1 Tax=Elysia marginata TaxID=1093978 RepID=A0AAV4IM18_9GAST|nr:hypothetical protein ElyMa_001335900 [Elysia marginata]
MKRIKTQPVAAKAGLKPSDKESSHKQNVTEIPRSGASESRNGSKETPKSRTHEGISSNNRDTKSPVEEQVRHAGASAHAHQNKDQVKVKQRNRLPDELSSTVTPSSPGEDADAVRTSIVGQILASVRGESSAVPPLPAASASHGADDRGHKPPRKSSPPPVAARVHKSKPTSSSNRQLTDVKQVQITPSQTVHLDSQSSASRGSSAVSSHPKPSKPPRANTNISATDKSFSEKVGSETQSKQEDVKTADTSVSSDSEGNQRVLSESKSLTSCIRTASADFSSSVNVSENKELRSKPPINNPLSPSSNTDDLSNSTHGSITECNAQRQIIHNNDTEGNDEKAGDIAADRLVHQRHEVIRPVSATTGEKGGNSSIDGTRKPATPAGCKSGEIIEPSGQSICRDGDANTALSVTAAGPSTSEFPQSLSADSGIGSPTSHPCVIGREREREGLRPNTFPDNVSPCAADSDTNQITSSPITSPDCPVPSTPKPDSTHLQVQHNSSDHGTSPLPPSPQTIARTTQNSTDTGGDEEHSQCPTSPVLSTPTNIDEQNSKTISSSVENVNDNKDEEQETIPGNGVALPPNSKSSQDCVTDNQTSNGDCSKEDSLPTDIEKTNNNDSIKKKVRQLNTRENAIRNRVRKNSRLK